MSRQVSDATRQFVIQRAGFRCEYCLMRQEDFFFAFEVDHIISVKHEGSSDPGNLALACGACNRHKGTNLGTYLDNQRRFVRLFDPRRDIWSDHFELQEDGQIIPQTRVGRATLKILQMNDPDRIILRKVLMAAGRYP